MLSVILPEGVCFSHWTAMRLNDLWGPTSWDPDRREPLHVLRTSAAHPTRLPTVADHRARTPPCVRLQNLTVPVVAPEHVFAQLANKLGPLQLVVLGDSVVRWRSGRTKALLRGALQPGERGVRRARAALEEVREGSNSPEETRARLILADAGFPEPSLNAPIYDADGAFVAFLDLYWEEFKVGYEYNGQWHYASEEQLERDRRRIERIEATGVQVFVSTKDDRNAMGPVIWGLRRAMGRRGEPAPSLELTSRRNLPARN
ncbi:hypothetical protein [Arsenicicoccus bolidensis]|uniref:hypothetical protein n=1 Tax=Arsenicicoccus bolidensis TaxID=229480 RepID=UPI000422AA97|nr:hypothetical protein [Arsenicicoccus bolidensis]